MNPETNPESPSADQQPEGEETEGPKTCPACGKKLPSIANFCGYCGERLTKGGKDTVQ